MANLRTARTWDCAEQERLIAERVAAVPGELTEHESVFERRHLYESFKDRPQIANGNPFAQQLFQNTLDFA